VQAFSEMVKATKTIKITLLRHSIIMNRKYTGFFILATLLMIFGGKDLFAQDTTSDSFAPLQFTKNAGQWDSRILYKADLPGSGHVFLTADGFAYTLFNQQDIAAMENYYHGQGTAGNTSTTSAHQNDNDHDDDQHHHSDDANSRLKNPTSGGGNGGNTTGGGGSGNGGTSSASDHIIHAQMYEVNFVGANKDVAITNDHSSSTYYNYIFGSDSTKWVSNVHSYQGVTYKNMYNDIDVRVYSEASQLKYDLIVYPGGDFHQIKLQYTGTNGLSISQGELIVATSVGNVVELPPYCYQLINNQKVVLKCYYELSGDEIGFKVSGSYNKNYPVIIDPTLIFSTFTGSKADNWGYTATYDAQGDMYVGGIVFGQGYPLFPTSPGPFQANFGGGTFYEGYNYGFDMGIGKFNPTGTTMLFATYIGGNGNDQPHSLIVNSKGDLVIAGRTQSSNYPLYPAKNTVGHLGGWDIVLTELNPAGTSMVGSIKIGGSNDDGVNISSDHAVGSVSLLRNYGDDARSEVIVDGSDNVYLASCTQSSDFPVTAGVFQPAKGDASAPETGQYKNAYPYAYNQQDGVLIKLTPNLSAVTWSSFLGGNGDDAAYVLKLDNAGNIFVAGATSSTNLKTTPGVIQPAYGGGVADGFIAEVSNDGSTLERLTYLGTSSADEIYGIGLDNAGYVYICGTTEGTWTVTPNAHYPGINIAGKQFIAKLQPDLSAYVYSTVFGTNSIYPNISPVAFLVDRCENVYVSGWGGTVWPPPYYDEAGTTGLPVTPGAIKSTTDGEDFYFFVLKKNATGILYASFFGQNGGLTDHVDGGTSRFDPNGIIYEAICANCGHGAIFPTTPGVWSPTNQAIDCNEVGLKMAFNLAGVSAGLRTANRDTSGCIPLTIDFEDTVRNAKSYIWDFGDGSPQVSTTSFTENHTYSAVGTYTVMLIAIDSSSCNVSDTTYLHIRARNDAATIGFDAQKVGPCTSLSYQFINTSTPPAGKPFSDSSFQWNFGDGSSVITTDTSTITHGYSSTGSYNVTLELSDTNYCNSPEDTTQTIRLAANVQAIIGTPNSGCAPYLAQFTNNSLGGLSFQWDFGDGSPQSTAVNPTHLYANPGTYIVMLTANDSTTCNKTSIAYDTIVVHANPTAGFNFSPVPPQENTAEIFTNTSVGATSYLWNFGDGSPDDKVVNPSHVFPKTGTFDVCLKALNQWGCADSICQAVSAIIIPDFDVPSAFSPNGDGLNDVFMVRGFGITKFEMRIYNRWGQMVYEGTDPNQGWDGTFKGKPQPMDAYGYVINIEFSDGTKTTKTGSVTLLR
jgi:gliding motility-associated-like protein